MKIITLLFAIAVLISCNETTEIKETNNDLKTDVSIKKDTKVSEANNILKQQGDYTALFNREARDCGFINPALLAEALEITTDRITKDNRACNFNVAYANGDKTRFYFKVEPWKNKGILKSIESSKKNREIFGKDSKLSQYKISETGDTYLSMHQNRMIRILNETSDTAIIVIYNVEMDPNDTDYAKKDLLKDIAREQAYSIANFLLNTYKK